MERIHFALQAAKQPKKTAKLFKLAPNEARDAQKVFAMLAPNVRTSNPLATKDEFVGDALDEPEIPFEVPPDTARRLTEDDVALSLEGLQKGKKIFRFGAGKTPTDG